MQRLSPFIVLIALAMQGCASNPGNSYIYFPDLGHRALSGDVAVLREVLAKADTTSPGEQLEELAEILSKTVRPYPAEFLRAQSTDQYCFGVDFMGPAYVDNEPAARREQELRRKALVSVSDPSLAPATQRCLAVLNGS
jgi:hypothetical protein